MALKKLLLALGLITALVGFAPQAISTVSNTAVSTTTGMGNGSTTSFPITFDFRSNSWITVTKYDTSTSPVTVTSIPQQGGALGFTVSGGNPGTAVVMGTAPTNTQYLTISRAVPLTQGVVLNPASIFPYQGLSSQLDQITLALQNINAAGGPSTVTGNGGSGSSGSVGGLPSGVGYNLLGWNSSGASVVNYPNSAPSSGDILKFNGSSWGTYALTQSGLMSTLNGSPNTPLSAASGGSGVTNSGNFTWGSNPITLTTTGTTNLTLPTSGSLISGTVDTANTANTIVKRDGSGNFSAGTVTANLTGNVTGNVTGSVTGNVTGTATNVTGVVAIGNGGTGQTSRQSAINSLLNASTVASGTFARYDGTNVTLDTLHIGDVPTGFARSKLAQDTANTIVVNDAQGNMSVLTGGTTGNVPVFNGTAWTVGPQGSGLAGIFPYGDDTGAANAYVVASPNPPVLGYAKGIGVSFVAANTNTSAVTLDVASLGAQNILHWDGTVLNAGDIVAGQMVIVQYDGSNFQLIDPNFRSYSSVSHEWINAVSAEGQYSSSQPASSDLSDAANLVLNNQANTYSGGPQSLGTQVLTIQLPNDTSTGTTVNKLAKISAGKVVITAISDTGGALGVVVAGAGTSGSADIAQIGQTTCVFDNATTSGDYVQISSSVAGDCHDAGSTAPSTGQIVGRVLSTNGGAGTYAMSLQLAGSGGSGTVTSVAMTGDGTIFNSTVTGSPITGSGTLVPALLTQAKNTFLSGPSSGANAAPTFRLLAGADLPNPSSSSLGGIQSYAAVSNQWINSISTSGIPSSSQPAFTNISGNLANSQLPTAETWPSSGTVQSVTPANHGVVISGSGASANVTGAGTANQVLTSNGAAADPSFQTPIIAALAQGGSLNNMSTLQVRANQITQTTTNTYLLEGQSRNILANPSFEASTFSTGWTLTKTSGTTMTSAVETSTVADGKQAAKISLTAAYGTWAQSVTPTISIAGQNYEAYCRVNISSAVGLVQVCALEAGAEQNCITAPVTSTYQYVVANFVAKTNGDSLGVEVKSTVADTTSWYVDDCAVNPATNLGSGTFTTPWSSYTVVLGGTTTAPTPGTNTQFAASRRVGDSAEITWTFKQTAGGSGGSGTYLIPIPSGLTIDSTKTTIDTFFGTNLGPATFSNSADARASSSATAYVYPYDSTHLAMAWLSAGSPTLSTWGSATGGLTNTNLFVSFTVTVPITQYNDQSMYRPDATPATWSGYLLNSGNWTNTNHASMTAFSGGSTSVTQRTNVNMGTVSPMSSQGAGITFTPPKTGTKKVCATTTAYNTSSTTNIYELADGAGVVINDGASSNTSTNQTFKLDLCGFIYVSSLASPTTVQIAGYSSAGTFTIGGGSQVAGNTIYWTIEDADSNSSAPLFTGNVTSNNPTSSERVERIAFGTSTYGTACTSSPCTIFSQSGSWVTSVTRNSAGRYLLNVAAGIFSGTPSCSIIGHAASSMTGGIMAGGTPSSTAVYIATNSVGSSPAATDDAVDVVCMGPR